MKKPISFTRAGILAESNAVRISATLPRGRLSLRTRGDVTSLDAAFGITLPDQIGNRSTAGEIEAARLGPDEWTILAPADDLGRLIAGSAAVYDELPHSLVDISGREVTLLIEGPQAAELLTLGCARDIDSIGVGTARRTVFDGVTVVLWRDAENRFRMDIWNSFASHLSHLLSIGCRELAAEIA